MFAFWISCYCLTGCAVSDVWICVAILGLSSWRCCAGGWCYLLFVLGRTAGCWLTLCLGLGGVVPSLRFWFSALGFGALV